MTDWLREIDGDLDDMSPAERRAYLEDNGYDVPPLSQGPCGECGGPVEPGESLCLSCQDAEPVRS